MNQENEKKLRNEIFKKGVPDTMYQSEFKSNQLTASANGLGVDESDSVVVDWAEGENIN